MSLRVALELDLKLYSIVVTNSRWDYFCQFNDKPFQQ